jgi:hypothetical protein
VLFARRNPNHISGVNFLDQAAPALHPATAGSDNQKLAQHMGVPGGSSARFKGDTFVNSYRIHKIRLSYFLKTSRATLTAENARGHPA